MDFVNDGERTEEGSKRSRVMRGNWMDSVGCDHQRIANDNLLRVALDVR